MTHFACITIPAHGHINPMAAIARELVRRGHRVTFFHVGDVAPMIERLGFAFEPTSPPDPGGGRLVGATRDAGRVNGLIGIRRLIRHFAEATHLLCQGLPEALRRLSVDMILTDQLEAAGGLVGYHLGLPFISIAAALPLNWEVGIPSAFVGWSYGETSFHRARNIVSDFAAETAMGPIHEAIEAVATPWRIRVGRRIIDYGSGLAQLSQLTPALDYPRRQLIGCFHYCGPFRDTPVADAGPAPPRHAFVSLGTLQGHRVGLFETIAKAARANGLEVTMAHAGLIEDRDVARLSRLGSVHAFVDQDETLARSRVAILHGGLNTVLDACRHGVPTVLVPLAYEQAAIAARVRQAGAGRVVKGRVMRGARLSRDIGAVCEQPRYAAATGRLATEIRRAGGTRRAADIIERVWSTGRPVLASQPGENDWP